MDGLTGITLNASVNNLSETVQNTGDRIERAILNNNEKSPIEGLTKKENQNNNDSELLELLKLQREDLGILNELLDSLNPVISELSGENKKKESLDDKSDSDILSELLTVQQEATSSLFQEPSKKNAKKSTPTGKPPGVDVLKDLSLNDGIGFVVLWHKLDDIHKTLTDKDKKKGGIGDFFSGLLEGAAGIALLAVALIVFAGALLLFNLVDWGDALLGMVSFSLFTIGMILVAKKVSKDIDTIVLFGIASIALSVSLAAFAGALLIFNFIEWGPALVGLAMFGIFEAGMLFLANHVKGNIAAFIGFAIGSATMSVALLTFSISIVIAAKLMSMSSFSIPGTGIEIPGINPVLAIQAIGYFTLFELGMAKVANLLEKDKGNFIQFAIGSVIMSAALLVFSFSILIASKLMGAESFTIGSVTIPGINIKDALIALGLFMLFETGMVFLANSVSKETGNFIKFAIGSSAMSIALIAFSVALLIVSNITDGIDILGFKIDPVDPILAVTNVGLFFVFVVAMGLLAKFTNGQMGQMVAFTGVSMLMSLALVFFGFALAASVWAVAGGDIELGPLGTFSAPTGNKGLLAIEALALMAGFIAAFALLGAAIMVPFVAVAAVAAVGVSLLVSNAVISLSQAMVFSAMLKTGGEISWEGKQYKFIKADNIDFKGVFQPFLDIVDALKDTASKIGIFASLGIAAKMIPLSEAVIKVAESTRLVKEMYDEMKGNEESVNGDFMYAFMPFIDIMQALANVASTLDKEGRKSFKLVIASIEPIANTLLQLTEMIDKYSTLKDKKEEVDIAIESMNYIMVGTDGNGGFVSVMNVVASSLSGMKESSLIAVKAMVPVIEALGAIVSILSNEAMTTLMSFQKDGGITQRQKVLEDFSSFLDNSVIPLLNRMGKRAERIQAASDLFGHKGQDENSPGTGLYGVMETIANIMAIDIQDRLSESAKGIEQLIYSLDYLSSLEDEDISRMESLSKNIPEFTAAIAGFNSSSEADALTKSITEIKDAVSGFGGKNNPFDIINKSILETTKSISLLNKSLDGTISKMKSLARESEKAFKRVIDKIESSDKIKSSSGSTAGGTVGSNQNMSLEDIIKKWDNDGVPVRGFGSQTKPEQKIFTI